MVTRIYLDHAATAPMLPQAKAAVAEGEAKWANPSSPHREGRAARAALEDARARIKAAYGWPHELIFTSGASEALALVLNHARPGPRWASAVEHDAVLRHVPKTNILPVDSAGRLRIAKGLEGALADNPDSLVAVQWANSETGIVQYLDHIASVAARFGALLLVDASQCPPPWPIASSPWPDFIVLSAHKLGGPPGIGALLVRDLAMLSPSGGQESGYRGGTENMPAAMGFAAAVEAWRDGWVTHVRGLRDRLDDAVRAGGGIVIEDGQRTPRIGAYRLPGMKAVAQLIRLDAAGFAVSAGSACSSGSLRPSHVLTAMGWSDAEAGEVIRVSIAPTTTEAEIEAFIREWTAMAREARARAA